MATRDVLKVNLRRLLTSTRREVADVAREAGVPIIEVYEALAGDFAPTADWLECVGAALGVEGWELICPQQTNGSP